MYSIFQIIKIFTTFSKYVTQLLSRTIQLWNAYLLMIELYNTYVQNVVNSESNCIQYPIYVIYLYI